MKNNREPVCAKISNSGITSSKKTLNDVCEFIVDCLHETAPTQDHGLPLIRTPNIGKGRLNLDDVYRVSEDTYDIWTQRAVPQTDDLILAREATAGNVAIIKEGQVVCLGQRTVHLRPDRNQVDPDFLCYFLLAPKQQGALLAGETGATSKHVNMLDIRRLPLPGLPDITIQRTMGRLLARYDDLTENNRRRIQLLEKSARLLYREWFIYLRFPGHEHVRIIDGVPEGWEKGTVSNFYKTTSGGTPSRKNPDFFTGDINWVKTQELQEGFIFETDEKITEDAINNSSAKLFPVNTVLVAMYGATIGQTAILANPATTNQACCALFADAKQTHYIHAYLFLRENKNGLINLSQGSAQKNINQEIIKNYEMVMPSKMIMNEFIGSVEAVFDQIKNLWLQIIKLKIARDILLPRLMNGEIAV